jgi:hypothetical protein
MLDDPQSVLLAAFAALSEGNAAALARLGNPADEAVLRTHVAKLLDMNSLPSEEAFAKSPFPPEMARILRNQVAAGYQHLRRRIQSQYEVRDAADLENLSFEQLIAAAWKVAERPYFHGLRATTIGTLVEGPRAFVLFRLATDAMPEGRDTPDTATFVAVQDSWRLRLDVRAPLLLPGTQGVFRFPEDKPPEAAV